MGLVNLRVAVNKARIARIAANLRKCETSSAVSTVDLSPFAKKALVYLLSIFPSSSSKDSHNKVELGAHLRSGWRVGYHTNGLGFSISNVLSKDPEDRAAIVLGALDKGTAARAWRVPYTFKFPDTRNAGTSGKLLFTTFKEGRVIRFRQRAGLHYEQKTLDYIVSMVPEMKEVIASKVRQIIAS